MTHSLPSRLTPPRRPLPSRGTGPNCAARTTPLRGSAPTTQIHRRPGYGPAELFTDPEDLYVRLEAAKAVARKKPGMRHRLGVVPHDP